MLSWVNLHQSPCNLGGAVGVPTNRLSTTEKRNEESGWRCSPPVLLPRSEHHPPALWKGQVQFSNWGDLNPHLPRRREHAHHQRMAFGEGVRGTSEKVTLAKWVRGVKERRWGNAHQGWRVSWSKEQRLCLLIILMNVIPATLSDTAHSPVPREAEKASRKGEKVLRLKNPRDWAVIYIPSESEMCA